MICRRCILRAPSQAAQAGRQLTRQSPSLFRTLSTTLAKRNAATSAAAATPAPDSASPELATPIFSTPLADDPSESKPALSACPEGTVLQGLNYFKNKADPVALADDAYPEWLWRCLKVTEKHVEDGNTDAEAEFSKSKKQRRLAAKRQRALEVKLLAEGNLEVLAPKIPLQQQSINMPANEEGTTEGAIAAAEAREELRKAMRKERKAKIKESNYLKSM
ncbi:mitochondrial ribosomal protein L37-domain-containing protein [Pseudomassariella vexata]|uniref:Large ribosomal subunit protein mL54 n=1 Tax=Pseudomassariella vexata TaxID=1141098 RepID=A0A1Y2E2U8_9PEZI|nr:mitochondrial ribosomal protein L37-domain-containing protein [Pseudomassariella vexata]ORY65829.1 mitochondrial ribosomal protein L37-domain-containing protein [Pseudomassariella vexata]